MCKIMIFQKSYVIIYLINFGKKCMMVVLNEKKVLIIFIPILFFLETLAAFHVYYASAWQTN